MKIIIDGQTFDTSVGGSVITDLIKSEKIRGEALKALDEKAKALETEIKANARHRTDRRTQPGDVFLHVGGALNRIYTLREAVVQHSLLAVPTEEQLEAAEAEEA